MSHSWSLSVSKGGKNKDGSGATAYPPVGGPMEHAENGMKVLEKAQVLTKRPMRYHGWTPW